MNHATDERFRRLQLPLELSFEGYGSSTSPEPVNYRTPTKVNRNQQIRERFANGEAIADLAREYNITDQRVFQIIHFRSN
jgi:hypothetical protein